MTDIRNDIAQQHDGLRIDVPAEMQAGSDTGRSWSSTAFLTRYSGLFVLVAMIVAFSLSLPDTFATSQTLKGLVADQAVTAIVSLGLMVAFAAGAFDLSVAATLGLAVVFVTWLQAAHGVNAAVAIIATLLLGALVGAVNGFIVTRLKVNSFIATLGMSSILAAVVLALTGGVDIVGNLSQGFLNLGQAAPWGIPVLVFYMIVLAVVAWVILEHTPSGRRLYAVGSNPEAARLSGVPTVRYVFSALVISGVLAAVAGIVFAAQVGTASLDAGTPYLLPAFAAVLLGTTQARPGRANVWGTIIAIFLVAVLSEGLQLMGASVWVSDLFNGLVLIVAVALARLRRSGSSAGAGIGV
jgi:ribose transport system permease protein